MRIPEIRDRLHELAEELGVSELHELAEHTRRRPPLRRAKPRWPRLSPSEQDAVRVAWMENRTIGHRELANRFSTSIGRISEALRGFRT